MFCQLLINGEIVSEKKLHSNTGPVYTNKEGIISDISMPCENQKTDEQLLIYALPEKIGHCFLYNESMNTVSLQDEKHRLHRVQVEFSTTVPCTFFVNTFSKSKMLSPGKHLEVVAVGSVSSITCVFVTDGYKPFLKKVPINTKDNKLSKINIGNIQLTQLPCYKERIIVTCDSTISSEYKAMEWYATQGAKMFYYYSIYDNIAQQRYVAEKCVERSCFNKQSIELLPTDMSEEKILHLLENTIPSDQEYIKISPVVNFPLFTVSTTQLSATSKDTLSIETPVHVSEKTSNLWINILIGIGVFFLFELLYRILWKESLLFSIINKFKNF